MSRPGHRRRGLVVLFALAVGAMAARTAGAQQVTTLEEALRTGLTLNPNIESSAAAAAAATSSRWADWGAFLPTIDLRGSLSPDGLHDGDVRRSDGRVAGTRGSDHLDPEEQCGLSVVRTRSPEPGAHFQREGG